MTIDYEALKAEAKLRKTSVVNLLALDRNNDPFYVGTPQDKIDAQWFLDCWKLLGYSRGVHIRRMHYQLASTNPRVLLPDGTTYENTVECWKYTNDAAKSARYLKYVDPAAFVDKRNEDPVTIYQSYTRRDVTIDLDEVEAPSDLELDFPAIPGYAVENFTSPQRYHLEIWCEKSGVNDILKPICRQYGAVLMYGKGELSITMALDAVRRFEQRGKPVRIFYVSDFDPAGMCMPVSMSRKVEYFLDSLGLDLDVKLFPVVLTAEQVKRYDRLLPTPIKESERRKAKFEARFGNGGNVAVELDALETLYPGELRRILQAELGRYYDVTLDTRVFQAESTARQLLEETCEEIYARYRGELAALAQEEEALQTLFDEQIKERMARHTERKYELALTIQAELEESQPDITEEDLPEAVEAVERTGALFDSSRDYWTQNDVYQEHKGKERIEEIA